ncbi:MAG: bifunctional oligoribonuclease/PAP phosphatase NrnA [Clostridia bacterium]|nr:bifunctional oligoribonuclease/PAP phosphatase NrnA [Clostridia bacterium]
MFEAALELIKKYDTIIIHRHTNPDGDALGSQLGLKYLINDNFPDKKVYVTGDSAGRYSFIEGSEMDNVPDEAFIGALAILLDMSAMNLVSDTRWKSAAHSLRIDHHVFLESFGDTEISDHSFESCAGMIASMAKECGLKLSPKSAKAIYTGMVTDSGRFKYDSVNSRTFENAAFLMTEDFSTSDIYSSLYVDDYRNVKLRAEFVLKIRFTDAGVAYIYTTAEEMKHIDADVFTVSRGMVNTMSDLRGVSIWVNFTEAPAGVFCEIRSSVYNINRIATAHGGGGHQKASGATLKDREEAMRLLTELDALALSVHAV